MAERNALTEVDFESSGSAPGMVATSFFEEREKDTANSPTQRWQWVGWEALLKITSFLELSCSIAREFVKEESKI